MTDDCERRGPWAGWGPRYCSRCGQRVHATPEAGWVHDDEPADGHAPLTWAT